MTAATVSVRSFADDFPHPAKGSEFASGYDLRAAIDEPLVLSSGARALVPTGVAIALPAGFEGQVRPRSGLAVSHGVTVLNAPGTIDSDYRGEIKVVLINHGDSDFTIRRGDRIAQLVFAELAQLEIRLVAELDDTLRGDGGFGSTGTD